MTVSIDKFGVSGVAAADSNTVLLSSLRASAAFDVKNTDVTVQTLRMGVITGANENNVTAQSVRIGIVFSEPPVKARPVMGVMM